MNGLRESACIFLIGIFDMDGNLSIKNVTEGILIFIVQNFCHKNFECQS
jgi:hypothetical protein